MKILLALLLAFVAAVIVPPAFAQASDAQSAIVRDLPPGLQIPEAARPSPNFDADRATDAYLDLLSAPGA